MPVEPSEADCHGQTFDRSSLVQGLSEGSQVFYGLVQHGCDDGNKDDAFALLS
jgi:hypothetical protein